MAAGGSESALFSQCLADAQVPAAAAGDPGQRHQPRILLLHKKTPDSGPQGPAARHKAFPVTGQSLR